MAKSSRPKFGDEGFPLWKHPSGRWCKKVRGDLLMRRTPSAGRELDAKHFSNTLLVKFINQNPGLTGHWKIAASPRGTLTLPSHAGLRRMGWRRTGISSCRRKCSTIADLVARWRKRQYLHRNSGVTGRPRSE